MCARPYQATTTPAGTSRALQGSHSVQSWRRGRVWVPRALGEAVWEIWCSVCPSFLRAGAVWGAAGLTPPQGSWLLLLQGWFPALW